VYNGPLKELLIDTHEDGVAAYFFGGEGKDIGTGWGKVLGRLEE